MFRLIAPNRPTRATNSFEKIFSGIKPWGRRPVLDTGRGRFESFIPEFLCTIAGAFICAVYCAVAQLVERSPVKRMVPGSSPGSAVLEMIRIGKKFVLKTDAGKIRCRFESRPAPLLLSRRLIGRTSAFEAENLGSSPSNSELWLWSSSLRLRIVIPETWAQIPLATPCALRKESNPTDCKPLMQPCNSESEIPNHARIG